MQQNANSKPDPIEETSLDIVRLKTRKMQRMRQNPDPEEGTSSAAVQAKTKAIQQNPNPRGKN